MQRMRSPGGEPGRTPLAVPHRLGLDPVLAERREVDHQVGRIQQPLSYVYELACHAGQGMDGFGRNPIICRGTCRSPRSRYVAAVLLALTKYDFSVFIHVSAVVVGFGMTFAESILFPVAMRMSARNLPYVHRLQLTINQFFALPALVIIVATGIYQMSEGNWDYGDLWVSGTLTIVVIIALTLVFFFIPTDRRLLPLIEKTIDDAGDRRLTLADLPKEYVKWGRLEGLVGSFLGILLIVAIYFMTTKPGLG